jgi:hypothetical protein
MVKGDPRGGAGAALKKKLAIEIGLRRVKKIGQETGSKVQRTANDAEHPVG